MFSIQLWQQGFALLFRCVSRMTRSAARAVFKDRSHASDFAHQVQLSVPPLLSPPLAPPALTLAQGVRLFPIYSRRNRRAEQGLCHHIPELSLQPLLAHVLRSPKLVNNPMCTTGTRPP
jgi:hypothetical protein